MWRSFASIPTHRAIAESRWHSAKSLNRLAASAGRVCGLVGLLIMLAGQQALAEDGVVIHAGERAVIFFEFDAPPVTDQGDPVNVLALDIGGSYVDFLGESVLEQALIDGQELLATRQVLRGGGLRALFVTEDVPWNGVETNFDSIQDGSIQGVLIVQALHDERSHQSRIRFRGNLVTGRVTEGEGLLPGPAATITGCLIESPVFADRFDDQPRHTPGSLAHRECHFGPQG